MQVAVRLSGELATQAGRPRFSVPLADGATVADLTDLLRREYVAFSPCSTRPCPSSPADTSPNLNRCKRARK